MLEGPLRCALPLQRLPISTVLPVEFESGQTNKKPQQVRNRSFDPSGLQVGTIPKLMETSKPRSTKTFAGNLHLPPGERNPGVMTRS
jgi:hypothetical protein